MHYIELSLNIAYLFASEEKGGERHAKEEEK